LVNIRKILRHISEIISIRFAIAGEEDYLINCCPTRIFMVPTSGVDRIMAGARRRRGSEGIDIYTPSQHLGHASVKATEIYLAFLTPEQALKAKHGGSKVGTKVGAAAAVLPEDATKKSLVKQIVIWSGRVAEWFKAAVLKTAVGATPPWVRIPPLPP
jgi:hypothetical protein